jgi:hypothetical protein
MRPIINKMISYNQNDRQQDVGEVIEALTDIPVSWLSGEETSGDESGRMYFHVNSSRLIENAQNALAQAEPHTVLARLTELEKSLDRLGRACHDHRANAISNLTHDTLKLIDAADPFRLNSLISRFIDAAELTRSEDFFTPLPDMWSFFLFEAFRAASYTATKFQCLEGLVKYFVKFGSGWNKKYLWLVAQEIEDPNLMDRLTQCLREAGEEDMAELLDGMPEDRPLDAEALKIALLAWQKLG